MSCVCLGSGVSLLVLVSPCQAPLLGSMILPIEQCQSSLSSLSLSKMGLRFCLAAVEGILITQIFVGGTFYDIDCLLTGISYLVLECNRAIAFHTTEFSKYRQLQVLEKLLNDCFKKRVFAIVAFFLPALQVACCFSAIQLYDKIPLTSLPVYVGMYIDVLLFNFIVFNGAALVNTLTTGWICKLRKKTR